MAEKAGKKGGGSKLSRTETVTVRLDPKLRYMAELAARKQRRTLSSFIEWAIEGGLSTVQLDDKNSAEELGGKLWDVDEADRFVKLALSYPGLLTYYEQTLWKVIWETKEAWDFPGPEESKEFPGVKVVPSPLKCFDFNYLRRNWETFKGIAKGELSQEDLHPKEVD